MDSADIYWFSGTGNTLLVARAMAERFESLGVETRLRAIERTDPTKVDTARTLGIACPVAAQSTYPPVWEFVERLPETDGTGAFLVDTLMKFSGGILGPMRRRLEGKGYAPLGALEIAMPNNFFRGKPAPDADARCIAAGLDAARRFAEDLVAGRTRWPRPKGYERWFEWFARQTYSHRALAHKLVYVSADPERCTRCGLCEKLCPVGAIERTGEDAPAFADECVLCMRCFSYCPAEAILLSGKDCHRHRPLAARDFLTK